MQFDKLLFIEDLQGKNGLVAQDLAMREVIIFIDNEFRSSEDLELADENEELRDENISLEDENEKLTEQVQFLKERNAELRKENFNLGNLLDDIVIKRRESIFDTSNMGLK